LSVSSTIHWHRTAAADSTGFFINVQSLFILYLYFDCKSDGAYLFRSSMMVTKPHEAEAAVRSNWAGVPGFDPKRSSALVKLDIAQRPVFAAMPV
jgi:hypothetical protein